MICPACRDDLHDACDNRAYTPPPVVYHKDGTRCDCQHQPRKPK